MVGLDWAEARRAATGSEAAAPAAARRNPRRSIVSRSRFIDPPGPLRRGRRDYTTGQAVNKGPSASPACEEFGGLVDLRAMARIGIDLSRRVGSVDRRIFGNFIEHLGRCIYGGIFEEGSSLSDPRGYRLDVLEAVRPLRVPVLRWPGGNFVSGYHWLDGVGPVDARPRRSELAWYAEESNRFGTNEFIEYCRRIGAEPYICVNMGTGSMDEAQAWVEYCNGTGNTSWANLRRQHGHPEPHGVRYWGLGNEMYGGWQIGSLSAEDYVKKARTFALVMRRTDPPTQLIGPGHNAGSYW